MSIGDGKYQIQFDEGFATMRFFSMRTTGVLTVLLLFGSQGCSPANHRDSPTQESLPTRSDQPAAVTSTQKAKWQEQARKALKRDFQFEIDEVFSIGGEGQLSCAITGKVLRGKAQVGDFVQIPTADGYIKAKISKIQMFDNGSKDLDLAFPNDMVGLVFINLDKLKVKPKSILTMASEE